MTQVFEAGNAIGVIGEEGVIGGKPEPCYSLNPGPVFINGLVPDGVVGRGADGRPKVGVRLEDFEFLPVRNVGSQPIPKHFGASVKINEISGHEDALGLGFIENWLTEPEKSKAS